ncbi:MAG TPA: crosslink repair DNA glycosylase YcaQ family protein [Opitutaceae bacterium]|nr:crosslink repair DNA glycosylase YcaQ family protein [Opitutaceae bacterium]
MPAAPLKVSRADARRFMRRALLLDAPAPDVAAVLAHHGFVQIDPINVCGRMHDLILRNRVAGYREGDLMRHVHGESAPLPAAQRTAFEHHQPATGNLVVFTPDAWPHLQAAMRARTRIASAWSGRLTREENALVPRILEAIAARGPLASDTFADVGRSRQIWGAASLAKATMQKLFFHGRLLIARRQGSRRYYDLPERVLPEKILTLPAAKPRETARWEALLKLRQRRLALLKRAELALVEDLVQPVRIADGPLLHCLRADAPLFESTANRDAEAENASPRLIAPLDPLIYDRRVTQAVWDFDYTWEVYTPAAKRVRGYYALPVLSGHELVGHVEPRADRPKRRLAVVSRSVRRGHAAAGAVRELARFLGLR